jgi:hypothetical protein
MSFLAGIGFGMVLCLLVLSVAAMYFDWRKRQRKLMETPVLSPSDHIANLQRINREPYPDWEDLKTISDAVLALYLSSYGG